MASMIAELAVGSQGNQAGLCRCAQPKPARIPTSRTLVRTLRGVREGGA
jgi:hypothetical protein